MQYSIYGQNPKYPLADLVDPVVSGFLIISQEEVVNLLNAKDYRIAELESKLAGSKYTVDLFCVKYKELEKELKAYKCLDGDLIYITKKELLQRDLEQQAKGIMDVRKANVRKKRTLGTMWAGGHIIHNMQLAEEELRRQAKALKEQE
jgi:hypothetical protein